MTNTPTPYYKSLSANDAETVLQTLFNDTTISQSQFNVKRTWKTFETIVVDTNLDTIRNAFKNINHPERLIGLQGINARRFLISTDKSHFNIVLKNFFNENRIELCLVELDEITVNNKIYYIAWD